MWRQERITCHCDGLHQTAAHYWRNSLAKLEDKERSFMLGMIIDTISTFMYSKLLVILLIGAGIYFTIRTKLPQIRLFKDACMAVVEKPEDGDGVSSFQALMVSTASRVGTGNIVGVSTAICIGGFGSVFWMWVIAIIGSASAFDRKYTGTDI